jgi:O-antigen ligase
MDGPLRPVANQAANGARAALLAGPTVLAFLSGGYFDQPRDWAGFGAWFLVVVALIAVPRALPRGRPAWLALGGLGAFAAWTLLSITWSPLAGSAYHYGQIAVLYLGVVLAAAMLLSAPGVRPLVEPVVGLGVLVVVGYGISERLVPGLLHFTHSVSAEGRLEQPLTYWNAMGELAALGLVLSASLAGNATRPRLLRALAAAAAAPLGLGLYLSFSRGSLFAAAAGLLTLVVVAARREQFEGAGIALGAAVLASLSGAFFHGVASLTGSLATRESHGAITLALLVMIAAAAALLELRLAARRPSAPLRLPRRSPLIAAVAIICGLGLAIVVGAKEHSGAPLAAGATRFVSLQSNRYDYWGVALRAFDAEPVHGVGAGGWAVYWLRFRTISEFAKDAHSLPLQTLAELGLVGVLLLLAFVGGIGWTSLRALRRAPPLAYGPIAVLVTYFAHAPLDWDWEMPAVTMVAMVLGGMLISLAGAVVPSQSSSAMRGASRRKIQTASTQVAK